MHFPAGWEGYLTHDRLNDSADENDLGQEEIYIALEGSATLLVDGDEHVLERGVLARVGPGQKRRILPGPDGFRMVAVGGGPVRPTEHWRGRSSADRFRRRPRPAARGSASAAPDPWGRGGGFGPGAPGYIPGSAAAPNPALEERLCFAARWCP
jgi:hypothetical protein